MHVVGTAGHVDHGKSTLVSKLTGIDPDRFAEEKRRGLTIDLGFAWMTLPSGTEIGIVDVPGHERFIKNMLAGAGNVSICRFVVDATEGWKPQSAEHLAILDVLGVTRGVVALTKTDAVDEDTVTVRTEEVRGQFARTRLRNLPVIAVSAQTGAGLDELIAALDAAVTSAPPPLDEGRPRLWVDRVFTMAGSGTVVTGTLWGGSFKVGDEVELLPEGRRARVRGVQSHKRKLDRAEPGNRVALNLAGLERQGSARGDAVVTPGWWRTTHRIDGVIEMAVSETSRHELTEKGSYLFYAGSAETPATLRLYGQQVDGDKVFAQIGLRDPLPLRGGDRFVLRDAGRVLTFGGGVVLDPMPTRTRRDDQGRIELLRALAEAPSLDALLDHYGSIDAGDAVFRSGLSELPQNAGRLGRRVVSRAELSRLGALLTDVLARHHVEHPLEAGAPRARLPHLLQLPDEEIDALVAQSEDTIMEGTTVRLRSHEVALEPEQARERDRIVAAIEEAGFAPPLTPELGADPVLLRSLAGSGQLVKIDGFYLTARRAVEARSRVRAAIEEQGPMTVAQIRDLLGTSRKYAVPLCEWLDSTGATRRVGDLRDLGPRP